jgi:hypothetical protein
MTEETLAETLRVSQAHVATLRKDQDLPAVRVGKGWPYPNSLVSVWLLQQTLNDNGE